MTMNTLKIDATDPICSMTVNQATAPPQPTIVRRHQPCWFNAH